MSILWVLVGVSTKRKESKTLITPPPYSVRRMTDLEAVEQSGYKVASTFTGAGGSSLGFRFAGFKAVYASEFIEAARETYLANFPYGEMDPRDIREVSPSDILESAGCDIGELDVLEGSPPCAAFSQSGKLADSWKVERKYSDTNQRVDDLFWEYTRLLKAIQPKVFMAENVATLAQGVSKGYFLNIKRAMEECGYKVKTAKINALYLGAATIRERTIFIGVRNDLVEKVAGVPWFPTPSRFFYTFGDVMDGVEYFYESDSQFWPLPAGKMQDMWSWCRKKNEVYIWKAYEALYGKVAMFNHRYCVKNRPVLTMTQGAQCLYHPDVPRSLDIAEIKRIMTFPPDFILTGNFSKKWERVGRAVAPLMAEKIAWRIRGLLDAIVR